MTEDDGSLPLGAMSPLGLYYHDTQYLSGYALRVNDSARAIFYYVDSSNDVSTLGALSVLGKGRIFGTRHRLANAEFHQSEALGIVLHIHE